jgi:cell wall assembly regulator SMI1
MTPTVIVILVVLLVVGNCLLARLAVRRFFYPRPRAFPPASTDQGIDPLLARLEQVLRDHAPAVSAALRPGLGDEQIDALERQHGCRLSDELRALYRWRDGAPRSTAWIGLVPGHRFVPLAEVLEARDHLTRELRALPAIQWLVFSIFAAHRSGWLNVLEDGCGDGYFFDPARRRAEGSFFFCFAEDRTFLFFRTLADFLAGVIECYEKGIYRAGGGEELDEDYARSHELWPRFAEVR